MNGLVLRPAPLTAENFAPFGELLEDKTAKQVKLINNNTARRFDDMATIDAARNGGRTAVSLFRARSWPRPICISMLECHPLGSQAFLPTGDDDWLVVAAPGDGDKPDIDRLCCFWARGFQGVNYHAGVWHHPLLTLRDNRDFWVIDRAAPADEDAAANLRESRFATHTIACD